VPQFEPDGGGGGRGAVAMSVAGPSFLASVQVRRPAAAGLEPIRRNLGSPIAARTSLAAVKWKCGNRTALATADATCYHPISAPEDLSCSTAEPPSKPPAPRPSAPLSRPPVCRRGFEKSRAETVRLPLVLRQDRSRYSGRGCAKLGYKSVELLSPAEVLKSKSTA